MPEEHWGGQVELDITQLGLGEALLVTSDRNYPDVFIARVKSPWQGPPEPEGSEPGGPPGEYFVAFSRVCTHMGGHLLTPEGGRRIDSRGQVDGGAPSEARQVTGYQRPLVPGRPDAHTVHCPCHSSAFDLTAGGRVVIGQATCRLPQLQLAIHGQKLRVVGWLQDPKAPRALPYGATTGDLPSPVADGATTGEVP